MWKTVKKSANLLRDFSLFFYKGWQARLTIPYAKSFFLSFLAHLNQFRHSLYSKGIELHTIKDEKIKKLQAASHGLHSLLPRDARFTYSILMLVSEPKESFLRTSLEAVCNQSAPSLEILIACTQKPSKRIEEVLLNFKRDHPSKMQIFDFSKHASKEGALQQLAQEATGNFLFLMGEEDWIRPDLLLRYEQTLRIIEDPENCVLFCDFNRLSATDAFMPCSESRQPSELCFPYFFRRLMAKGLLVPASLWKKMGKHPFCFDTQEEDLLLRLDLAGAVFQPVPFCLYSVRSLSKQQEIKANPSFLHILEEYTKAKGLEWKWHPGYLATCARATPPLPKIRGIQVIIPFKDQKELTLKCMHSILKQKDVLVRITAVDNRSSDQSIAETIIALGGEVVFVDEPFNYSRLNNLAVKQTKTAGDCDVLLFLNNDVELEPDALQEMLRWLDQPRIGMVGCRLNFPDGRLQHGGVQLDGCLRKEMRWEHIEKLRHFNEMEESKILGIVDAVTAACAMMKREIFLEAGGFDEIWYPIGYSDTNLAMKLAAKGLKCFYTPYAVGIHHESVTRKASIEDFENSWWLHRLLIRHHVLAGRKD